MLRFIRQSFLYRSSSTVISIHPMLRFIGFCGNESCWNFTFQYISCYGLSATANVADNLAGRFQYISCYGLSGTCLARYLSATRFQYISCYGLSEHGEQVEPTVSAFQYISCYGLSSLLRSVREHIAISIHLMLRFIRRCVCSMIMICNFNTSHVTVYLLLEVQQL